ncbi:MAG: thymidine phosphorylase [Alphaproteobacteria bacterium]|nr:thymidine phosphorylase [Alphaproteobacteria bacterium]
MLFQEIIAQKRDGHVLSDEAIETMVAGIANGSASEGQVAAFAMAVFLNGMEPSESVTLTRAMTHSGMVIDWRDKNLNGPVVDKHSTGGIGDKVSLMLAPMVAACGGYVPMISGRGLGHTGGTLDKLESIAGYTVGQDMAQFKNIVAEVGCAIVGQTGDLAPADKRLYGVRDVTATVESIPLITASILCKKLASGLQGLVMDVKTGSGAFMQRMEDSQMLAQSIVDVANGAGLRTTAFVTEMGQPLGGAAGNAVEIAETVRFLTTSERDSRLLEVVLTLGSEMLVLGGLHSDVNAARVKLNEALDSGAAAEKFGRMVAALGGANDFVENYETYLPKAQVTLEVFSEEEGIINNVDTKAVGMAVLRMGGGRGIPSDSIDHSVGLTALKGIGDAIDSATPLALVHASSQNKAERAAQDIRTAYKISAHAAKVTKPAIVHQRISGENAQTNRLAS